MPRIVPTVTALAHGLHVVDPVGNEEEPEIAADPDGPGRFDAPPGIIPGQDAEKVQDNFNDDGERREQDDEEPAVRQARNL